MLRTDSWLGLVRFGSIRRRIPDLLERAARHYPGREWWALDRALFRVLYDEKGLSPHLHHPAALHRGQSSYKPWDGARHYLADRLRRRLLVMDDAARSFVAGWSPGAWPYSCPDTIGQRLCDLLNQISDKQRVDEAARFLEESVTPGR